MGSQPISNSESTNFLKIFFFYWQTEKKKLFCTNKKFISFSTAQTEENYGQNWGNKSVKKSDEFVICFYKEKDLEDTKYYLTVSFREPTCDH